MAVSLSMTFEGVAGVACAGCGAVVTRYRSFVVLVRMVKVKSSKRLRDQPSGSNAVVEAYTSCVHVIAIVYRCQRKMDGRAENQSTGRRTPPHVKRPGEPGCPVY